MKIYFADLPIPERGDEPEEELVEVPLGDFNGNHWDTPWAEYHECTSECGGDRS